MFMIVLLMSMTMIMMMEGGADDDADVALDSAVEINVQCMCTQG